MLCTQLAAMLLPLLTKLNLGLWSVTLIIVSLGLCM